MSREVGDIEKQKGLSQEAFVFLRDVRRGPTRCGLCEHFQERTVLGTRPDSCALYGDIHAWHQCLALSLAATFWMDPGSFKEHVRLLRDARWRSSCFDYAATQPQADEIRASMMVTFWDAVWGAQSQADYQKALRDTLAARLLLTGREFDPVSVAVDAWPFSAMPTWLGPHALAEYAVLLEIPGQANLPKLTEAVRGAVIGQMDAEDASAFASLSTLTNARWAEMLDDALRQRLALLMVRIHG